MAAREPITVSVTRTVKPGYEIAFEKALHEFVQRSLTLQGQQGVHIMRPAPGSASRDYGIVRKFADQDSLAAFHESPEYRQWIESVSDFTEGDARTEQLSGLESWFTMPGAPIRAFPKWKMACATFLGVFPVATVLGLTLSPMISSWPFLLRGALFNACVVALLTWLVMPIVTRTLHGWLKRGKERPL
jgi:antibiotic biosynthesis monooxygenase (ABM) superfamily enzyme